MRAALATNIAAIAASGLAAPVFMFEQGSSSNGALSSFTLTLPAAVAVGDLLKMEMWNTSNRTISSVTDDGGVPNTYSNVSVAGTAPATTTDRFTTIYCVATTAMPIGRIITITLSGSAAVICIARSYRNIAAASPYDIGTSTPGGADLAPTIGSAGTPANVRSLISAATFVYNTAPSSVVITPDSDYSNQLKVIRGTTGALFVHDRIISAGVDDGRVETISGVAASIWFMTTRIFKGL